MRRILHPCHFLEVAVFQHPKNFQSKIIKELNGVVPYGIICIHPTPLPHRVPVWPATDLRGVESIAVIDQPGFRVGVLGGEAERDLGGGRAVGGEEVAEGVVFKTGDGGARGVGGGVDVSVAVVGGVIDGGLGIGGGGGGDGQQSAHGPGALEGSGEVHAPDVVADGLEGWQSLRHVGNVLADQQPVNPGETVFADEGPLGRGGEGEDLLDGAAGERVVLVDDLEGAGGGIDGGGFDEAVFLVPCVGTGAGGGHAAVEVVGERLGGGVEDGEGVGLRGGGGRRDDGGELIGAGNNGDLFGPPAVAEEGAGGGVDGDGGDRTVEPAGDIHGSGRGGGGELVELVGDEFPAGAVAGAFEGVAGGIVVVGEAIGAVGEAAVEDADGAGDLADGIVGVVDAGAVGAGDGGTAVAGVVGVVEGGGAVGDGLAVGEVEAGVEAAHGIVLVLDVERRVSPYICTFSPPGPSA